MFCLVRSLRRKLTKPIAIQGSEAPADRNASLVLRAIGPPAMETDVTKQFQVGHTYFVRAICDYDTIFSFKVVSRSAKTITINYHGKDVRRGVKVVDGIEQCYPMGRFSMAPVITAWSSSDALGDAA